MATAIDMFEEADIKVKSTVEVPQARAVQQNLSMINVSCKAWTGRVQDREARIQKDGHDIEEQDKLFTSPCKKLDMHPIFETLAKNTRAIEHLKLTMCFNIGVKGVYAISNAKIGEFWAQLSRLNEDRNEILNTMEDVWEDAVGMMRSAHSDFDKFARSVPNRNQILIRFGLVWDPPMAITPVLTDDIDVSTLNDEDRWRVINESNTKIRQKTQTIVDQMMSQVFGEVLAMCTKINQGSIETGKRKGGAIDEMLTLLTRVQNFSTFANPEVLKHIEAATQVLSMTSINGLNTDPSVQLAIKTAMAPLAESVTKMMESNKPGSSKAYRDLEI